jgi:hypothetical protein
MMTTAYWSIIKCSTNFLILTLPGHYGLACTKLIKNIRTQWLLRYPSRVEILAEGFIAVKASTFGLLGFKTSLAE